MKKLLNVSLSVGLIIAVSLTFNSCKKFENYFNVIKGVIPENCVECVFIIENVDSDWEDEYGILQADWITNDELVYTYSPGGDNTFEVQVDWSSLTYTEPKREAKIQFLTFESSPNGLLARGTTIAEQEVKFKPSLTYFWDPNENKFEQTGEKSSKIEKSDNSDTGGTSGGGEVKDCENDPVSTGYRDKINAGTYGCQPCASCAALACYKYAGEAQEIVDAQIQVVKDEAAFYGYEECPELY